jgi:hypothetical protein
MITITIKGVEHIRRIGRAEQKWEDEFKRVCNRITGWKWQFKKRHTTSNSTPSKEEASARNSWLTEVNTKISLKKKVVFLFFNIVQLLCFGVLGIKHN